MNDRAQLDHSVIALPSGNARLNQCAAAATKGLRATAAIASDHVCRQEGFALLEKNLFSSNDLPAHLNEKQKFGQWQDIHQAEIWSVDYSISELPFAADIEAAEVGQVVLGQMAGTIRRASRQSANIAADGRDSYLLLINNGQTPLAGTQSGRAYQVGMGEAALVSAAEPLTMTGGDSNTWMNVVVPRQVLGDRFTGIDDQLARTIGCENEALELLKRYWHFLEAGPCPMSPDLSGHASDTIIDLLGLTIGVKGETADLAQARGLRAARLQAVLGEIKCGFADPNFSAHVIAKKLQLSPRYIQDLLQDTGVSLSERVTELRLQKARAMLVSGSLLKITDISMSCGFNELSYFHRRFRSRFGASPAQFRSGLRTIN